MGLSACQSYFEIKYRGIVRDAKTLESLADVRVLINPVMDGDSLVPFQSDPVFTTSSGVYEEVQQVDNGSGCRGSLTESEWIALGTLVQCSKPGYRTLDTIIPASLMRRAGGIWLVPQLELYRSVAGE